MNVKGCIPKCEGTALKNMTGHYQMWKGIPKMWGNILQTCKGTALKNVKEQEHPSNMWRGIPPKF